jgi:outer membrane protein assembly factor BamB
MLVVAEPSSRVPLLGTSSVWRILSAGQAVAYRREKRAIYLAVLLCLITGRFLAAEQTPPFTDWPHLRGPHYDAISAETNLADSWPDEGPPVLWTRDIGRGYSGTIIVGNRLYTQTQTLTKQKVLALDADTGAAVWEYDYDWPYDPGGMYPGPRATPTFSEGRIYFASPDGLIGCLDADTGRSIWSVNVKQKFDGRGTEFGYSCSPLIEDGKVFLPVGGPSASMVALDAKDGSTVWTSGKAPASYCSAIPITFRGTRQVIAFFQNELAGFDLKSGQPLWRRESSKGYDEHSNFPLYDEPYLRTSQAFRGGSDLYRLIETNRADKSSNASPCRIELVRHDSQMSNDVASSVLIGGHVYGFDLRDIQTAPSRPSRGSFRCLDFKTGKIRWSSDRPGHASIAVADGKLFLFNDRGEVLLVRADPHRYEELARTEVFRGEICWTAPALSRGRLYLRSPTRIACLFVGKPDQMDRRQRERSTPASAVAKTNRIDLSWLLGAERECPFELPDVPELRRWYVWSLAALATAGLVALCFQGILRLCRDSHSCRPARIMFWSCVLTFGLAATPLANRYSSEFVFTWPLFLVAVHQLVLAAIRWSNRPDRSRAASWAGLAAAIALALVCFVYYQTTRSLSLAPGWYFLLTFLVAWPVAVPAARRLLEPGTVVADLIWMLAVFSIYYWSAAGLMLLRVAIGR